jgi:hypothetical protein
MRGSCHCGAVRIEVPAAPAWVGSCNCSICRRTGLLWSYYRPEEVRIEAPEGATTAYIWGDRCLALHHCGTCGCITHWQNLMPDPEKMGVNALLLDGFDRDATEIRKIDGASF